MKKLIIFPLFLFLASCFSDEPKAQEKQDPLYLDVAASWDVSTALLNEFIEVSKLGGIDDLL